jgi:ligand-binding sensor domain-containing protein
LPFRDAITCLHPDGQQVWIGTGDSGLWRWDEGRLQKYRAVYTERGERGQVAADSPLLDNRVLRLAVVGDELWIATLRGLGRLNRRTGKWGESIPIRRLWDETVYSQVLVFNIAAYRGHLLVLGPTGIKEYDPVKETWTDWPLPEPEHWHTDHSGPVLLVSQDKVWLATSGLLEYDPQSQLTRVFVRQPGLFPCLAEDGDFLWAGLSRLDRTKLPGLPAEGVTYEPPVRQDP